MTAARRTARRRHHAGVAVIAVIGGLAGAPMAAAGPGDTVDTALVLAVDVSGSVDTERYGLQMAGIAAAFEDAGVEDAILSGPRHALLVTLVQWSDKAKVSVPWTVIASEAEAATFAAKVRSAPRIADQFTCMSQMMRFVADKVLPRMPRPADRTVVDVSGDGRDNCNPPDPVDTVRNELVTLRVTINGLPILEGDEAATLQAWYRDHVVGGVGAFLQPASGFDDVARAMRQKFITEISSADRRRRDAALASAGFFQ